MYVKLQRPAKASNGTATTATGSDLLIYDSWYWTPLTFTMKWFNFYQDLHNPGHGEETDKTACHECEVAFHVHAEPKVDKGRTGKTKGLL